jgi:hypothetical protein
MNEPHTLNLAVVFLAAHAAIKRGMEVASTRVQEFDRECLPGPVLREGIVNYVRALSSLIQGHQLAEDDLAFPYFRDKMTEVPFDLLIQQHLEMDPILTEIDDTLPRCADDARMGEGFRQLNLALEKLSVVWHPHIRIEEEHFTYDRLVSLGLPDEEQAHLTRQIAEHSRKHTGPPYLVLPFLIYNLSPVTRAFLAGELPVEVTRHLVPVLWKDQWASMKPFLLD